MRILRGLTSRLLPCGCIAGIYETYDGDVVTLLDDRQPDCTNAGHEQGSIVPELAGVGSRSEVALETNRQRKS
jgi:hypothetical protein